jgi:short-subunit dehydrogenase
MNASTTPRRALITGASGGIGYELAQLFAGDGWNLVLAARNADKLTEISGQLARRYQVAVQTVPIDLTEPGAAARLVEASRRAGEPIGALVNNAGFGIFGPFVGADPEQVRQLIQLNIMALTELTRLLLPEMVSQRSGYVLNVASAAAFQPGPLMAIYYASKAYVLHFTEAIAEEVAPSGVRVTALCPGPTETGFMERASMEDSKLFSSGVMTAKSVAEAGYQGLLRGKRVVIPGFKFKLLTTAVRFAPREWAAKIAMAMQSRKSR